MNMFKDLTCILAKHPIMTIWFQTVTWLFPKLCTFNPSICSNLTWWRNSWIQCFSNSSWIPRARNDCRKSYNSLLHIWSPSETSFQDLELFCWKLVRSITVSRPQVLVCNFFPKRKEQRTKQKCIYTNPTMETPTMMGFPAKKLVHRSIMRIGYHNTGPN